MPSFRFVELLLQTNKLRFLDKNYTLPAHYNFRRHVFVGFSLLN